MSIGLQHRSAQNSYRYWTYVMAYCFWGNQKKYLCKCNTELQNRPNKQIIKYVISYCDLFCTFIIHRSKSYFITAINGLNHVSPSVQPSNTPSAQPSLQPFSRPTRQPTRQPPSQPSMQPSSRPSSQPSNSPSSRPSIQPSRQPTSSQDTICSNTIDYDLSIDSFRPNKYKILNLLLVDIIV